MSKHRLTAAAIIAIAALLPTPVGPTPAAAAATTVWREVPSPDGTLTRVLAPAQINHRLRGTVRADVTVLQETGPSAKRYNIAVLGDGYTAAEQSTFLEQARARWAELSAAEPFKTYRQAFNVYAVGVVSAESGVDNDPYGARRDTALNMEFGCDNGSERMLCVDTDRAHQYAALAPGADQVLVIANSAKYGGLGYPFDDLATSAGANARSGRIVIHELGHSMGDLVDEYVLQDMTYNNGEPRYANVSVYDQAQMGSRATKWASLLGKPTPDGGVIGTFPGAWAFYSSGIYRPSENSLMRSLDKPFNLVGLAAMTEEIRRRAPDVPPASEPDWVRLTH